MSYAVTTFGTAIDNIATTVAVAYTPPVSPITYPSVLAIASGTGIVISSGYVRVSTARSGSPLSILKATAITSGTNNGVAAVTVTGGGSGGTNNTYTDGTFTGGGGSGATFSYTISGGAVQNTITVNNPGSGYTSAPTAVFGSHGQSGVTTTVTISPWVLTISGTADSYTDQSLVVGDAAELRVTAGAFNDLKTAVNNLESGSNLPAMIAAGATIPTGQASRAGIVPATGSSSSSTKFLREDATWVVPSGGMTIGSAVSGGTANEVLFVDGSTNLGESAGLQFDLLGNSGNSASLTINKNGLKHNGLLKMYFDPSNSGFCTFVFYSSTTTTVYEFGVDWLGAYGGTPGNVNAREFYVYDDTAAVYVFGVNASQQFIVGPSNTNCSLTVNPPSAGVTGTVVKADGSIQLPHIANASATNDSLFWDTTASKLTYKDSGGTLHAI